MTAGTFFRVCFWFCVLLVLGLCLWWFAVMQAAEPPAAVGVVTYLLFVLALGGCVPLCCFAWLTIWHLVPDLDSARGF